MYTLYTYTYIYIHFQIKFQKQLSGGSWLMCTRHHKTAKVPEDECVDTGLHDTARWL